METIFEVGIVGLEVLLFFLGFKIINMIGGKKKK